MKRPSLADRLADYFRQRPGVWVNAFELFEVAGSFAWRSRISDLRRAPFNMVIENDWYDVRIGERKFRETVYRYQPPLPTRQGGLFEQEEHESYTRVDGTGTPNALVPQHATR